MQIRILFLISILALSSCGGAENPVKKEVEEPIVVDSLPLIEQFSKPKVDSAELKKNEKKIEAKYGEQWDFCDCVVKNDSINKAVQKENIPDAEFEKLLARLDEVDNRCKAFLAQIASQTPEQRAAHEKKVRKCLKAAGIKYTN